ncbi:MULTISPECIES: hypothetical protein [Photorhabdus]|nr:hypothetical protein [Photorhabdus luminescens]
MRDVNDTMEIIKLIENKDGYTMDSSDYPDYVNSVSEFIPDEALQFMRASWHYDHSDKRCPHDSRIKNLSILEESLGDFRVNNIHISLLGAYENTIELFYSNVFTYSIEKKKCEWPDDDYSHGDWLIDEILLSSDNFLMHEIIFTDAIINIKCKNISYSIV